MIRPVNRVACCLAAVVSLAASGCAVALLDKPLSDEKSSQVDERVIGHWQYAPEMEEANGARIKNRPPQGFTVARATGSPNLMAMTWVKLDKDGHHAVRRLPLYVSKIGEHWLVSSLADHENPKGDYFFLRYKLDEGKPDTEYDDTLLLYWPNVEALADAVDSGALAGTVKREKPKKDQVGKPRATDVRITAPSEAVRKYLAEQGDKLFDVKKPAKLHRLRPLFGK